MSSPDTSQDLTIQLQEIMGRVLQNSDTAPAENKLLQVTGYALANNGKMLRGRMLLEACRAVAGNAERALLAAAAVEYLHLGTLIHDDLIDLDELRRGKPAVWRQYGSDMALLSGDLLYFTAFQLLARSLDSASTTQVARVLDSFSTASMNLCLGQALEERLAGNCSARHEEYLEVVRLKTASLFRAALEMGALLGDGTEEQVRALGQFAEHLGIAFQIVDDLLPFTSNVQALGKPVTSDIKNHRLTAPVLYALAAADETDRQTLRAIFEEGRFDGQLEEAYESIQAILERTDARRRAEQEALRRYDQAIQLLQALPTGEGRKCLTLIASQLVQRNA